MDLLGVYFYMKTESKNISIFSLSIGIALLSGILWFYYHSLLNLIIFLSKDEDFSFGLLIPLVTIYLIYLKLPKLRSMSWLPSWFGLVIIAAGFVIYIFGKLVAIFPFPMISFIVVLIGIIYLLGGWLVFRELAFPIFILFLMVPLPSLILKQISFPLQLISSQLATAFLHALQVPVMRQGNIIDLGVRQLQVVAACSGLRYILSLSALGIIFCYFYQRKLWKAIIIIISIVPAAILSNALRVTAMAFWPVLQEGFWHTFSGWLIFIFCFGFLSIINYTLNCFFPPLQNVRTEAVAPKISKLPDRKVSYAPYLLMALLLFVSSAFLASRLAEASHIELLQSFDKFPMHLDSWQGKRFYLDSEMARTVGADDYLEATFSDPQNDIVSLWIAFFSSQAFKIGGTVHSPMHCLPGSGWTIQESKIVEVTPGFPVRLLLIEKDGQRQIVFYWYLHRGRWMASEYPLRFYMGLSGILSQRNDATIVRLITPDQPNLSSAQERLKNFTHLIIPLLPKFIPN